MADHQLTTDFLGQLDDAGEDQGAHAGADAGKGVDDHREVGKVLEEGGDDTDNHNGGNTTPRVATVPPSHPAWV